MKMYEHVPCHSMLTQHRIHACTNDAAGFELHLTERLSMVVYVVINECRNGEVRVVITILQGSNILVIAFSDTSIIALIIDIAKQTSTCSWACIWTK